MLMGVIASRARSVSLAIGLTLVACFHTLKAQDPAAAEAIAPNATPPADAGSAAVVPPPIDKHAFGVLPNYRTTEESFPFQRISALQKFTIATKDSIDGPSFILAGFFSGIAQLNNTNPSFGQGLKGYAHRYGTGLLDQDLGNYMTEAILPSLLHEDPRYFRKGTGSAKSRIFYAATRVFVTKTDGGEKTFNFAEVLGNGTVASLGNAYYPDERGFGSTMQRMFTQIGTDAISQVLKEFWPDVKRRYFHKSLRAGAVGE
jgi:hypothetical protein